MRCHFSFLTSMVILLANSALYAETLTAEDKVKAAFIYQLSQFAHWPETRLHDGSFVFCIDGNDAIFQALKPIEQRQTSSYHFKVKRFNAMVAVQCNVLYLEDPGRTDLTRQMLNHLRLGLLTVSSDSGFTRSGGMIELVKKDDRIRIQLNRRLANAADITFSAKLLEVAELVDVPPSEVGVP